MSSLELQAQIGMQRTDPAVREPTRDRSLRAKLLAHVRDPVSADRPTDAPAGRLVERDSSPAARGTIQAAGAAAVERERRSTSQRLATLRREVRGPVDGIGRLAERLAAEGTPQQRRLAEVIVKAASGLMASVDDAQDATVDGLGGLDLTLTSLDIVDVAEDVCGLFWDQAAAKGLDLAVYADPATPGRIEGDAVRLRQVLSVLTHNAIASTARGGVMIEVEALDPGTLCVSVRDTGPGLSKDGMAGIFDEVPEADASADGPDGAGSGLAHCKRRVEAMGGRFSVSSEVGRGSTFAFRLPVQALEPAAPWPTIGAAGGAAHLAVQGLASRRSLCRYLAQSGLSLGAAEDPGLALRIGDPAALGGLASDATPTIRLQREGDLPCDLASRGRRAPAALTQPFRREDLRTLLSRLAAGQPLCERLAASGPIAPPPAITSADAKLLHDLERALAAEQLTLAYQPQVERDGEKIIGVEALLRWIHPDRGPVSPATFIPLAERQGMIPRITTWVVDRMLAETRYLKGLQVAFNASALEFAQGGFVERLTGLIESHGYDPRRLEVEITETAILQNEGAVRETIDRLRALGLKVALDDFGAGYSSIGHLRRYPFDKLKIDREFITDCSRDMQAATVVHAVVSIGRALGMKVIAEGVETETQRKFLRVAGVHAMQGYLFGRAVSIDELTRMLASPAQRGRA